MTDLGEAGSLARETAPAKPAAGQAGLRIASASKDQVSIRHGHGSVLNRRNRRVRSPPEPPRMPHNTTDKPFPRTRFSESKITDLSARGCCSATQGYGAQAVAAGQHRGPRGKELLGQPRMTFDDEVSSALRGQRPEQRIMKSFTLVIKRIITPTIQKSDVSTRGLAQDTGLGLPRLGGASAGPRRRRRVGRGRASAGGPRRLRCLMKQLNLLLLLPGTGPRTERPV